MLEKEIKKYQKYSMIKNESKVNWFNRIRFWKYLREDYINATKDNYIATKYNYKKQDKINNLKKELSATQISLNIAKERIEQLEYDLKQKEKKTRKVKKQTK